MPKRTRFIERDASHSTEQGGVEDLAAGISPRGSGVAAAASRRHSQDRIKDCHTVYLNANIFDGVDPIHAVQIGFGMSVNEIWVRTDEAEDVAASIRHALHCRSLTSGDEQAWKWVVLALHSALQGACVCHLVTTASPIGAVTKKNAIEWLTYFEASRGDIKAPAPKTCLLSLPGLLKAVRKPGSAGDSRNLSGIRISDRELERLRQLHEHIRNQFVHFDPMGWSIEVSGIPEFGTLTARIIGEILSVGWAFRHKDHIWRNALRDNLAHLSGQSTPQSRQSGD